MCRHKTFLLLFFSFSCFAIPTQDRHAMSHVRPRRARQPSSQPLPPDQADHRAFGRKAHSLWVRVMIKPAGTWLHSLTVNALSDCLTYISKKKNKRVKKKGKEMWKWNIRISKVGQTQKFFCERRCADLQKPVQKAFTSPTIGVILMAFRNFLPFVLGFRLNAVPQQWKHPKGVPDRLSTADQLVDVT